MKTERIMDAQPKAVALLLACLLLGAASAQAFAQEYKEAYNAALEAANAKNYPLARAKFAEAATGAEGAGDNDIARKSKYVAAQIDYKLGNAALKENSFERALTHYTDGASIYAEYIKNQYGQGLALKKMGRIDEALEHWKEVAGASGDRKTSLAAARAIRDHFYFQASSTVSKRNATARDADRAITALGASEEFVEPNADFHYYTAVAQRIKGNNAQSVSAADKALGLHRGSRSDKAKIYFVKGEALVAVGDIEGAKEAFRNAAFGTYKPSAEHYLSTL